MQRYPGDRPVEIGLAWDKVKKGVDLDIQCVVFDALGVVIDACFFNNPSALNGTLRLSGDCKDGNAVAEGADEKVMINLPQLPQHAATIMCTVFCTAANSTLGDVAALHVAVRDPVANVPVVVVPAQGDLSAATGYVAVKFTKQQWLGMAPEWGVTVAWDFLFTKERNFMEALPKMQSYMEVPPEVQAQLVKQQPVFNLKKGNAYDMPIGLSRIGFGLGWDSRCDVDAGIVALSKTSTSEIDKIYFRNKNGCGGAVQHGGDNLTGEGSGDDETITVDLQKVPATFTHLFLMVNIYTLGHTFTDVNGEFVRVYNDLGQKKKEFLRYDHLDNAGPVNGVIVGCLSRSQTNMMSKISTASASVSEGWVFTALNVGAAGNTVRDMVDECQDLMKVGLDTNAFYALPGRGGNKARTMSGKQSSDSGCCVIA